MASLRDAARDVLYEAKDTIAYLVFWKTGRSWNSEALYEIVAADPDAICVNGYVDNIGPLEDMTLESLMDGIRFQREVAPGSLAYALQQVKKEETTEEADEEVCADEQEEKAYTAIITNLKSGENYEIMEWRNLRKFTKRQYDNVLLTLFDHACGGCENDSMAATIYDHGIHSLRGSGTKPVITLLCTTETDGANIWSDIHANGTFVRRMTIAN